MRGWGREQYIDRERKKEYEEGGKWLGSMRKGQNEGLIAENEQIQRENYEISKIQNNGKRRGYSGKEEG